jgi:hypothetical protein
MSERDGHLPPDEQTQRTRWELWAILIIVAAVLIGSFAWRAIGHHPAAKDTTTWDLSNAGANTAAPAIVATPASVSPPHAP